MNNNDKKRETFTLEDCPHLKFNGGYQQRCEGCGYTAQYIAGYKRGLAAKPADVPEVGEWREVWDELPDTVREVWITLVGDDMPPAVAKGFWNSAEWQMWADGGYVRVPMAFEVIAWREKEKVVPFNPITPKGEKGWLEKAVDKARGTDYPPVKLRRY